MRFFYKKFSDKVIMEVKCKTRKNVIQYEGETKSNKTKYNGEIIVNILNLRMGDGYHYSKTLDAFAFNRVIIVDDTNTLFIEAHYTKNKKNKNGTIDGFICPQAFVWRKKLINKL